MNSLVSVVVACYNGEKYIHRCLSSIKNQTYSNIEIIFVDDGSTDNSKLIVDEFEDIKYVYKNNGGISSARNEGIKHATGDYIIHIDCDDWIEAKMIENMLSKAISNNLDIVICDYYKDFTDKTIYFKGLKSEQKILTPNEYSELFIKDLASPQIWNKLYKRSLYVDNNIYYNEYSSLGEDLLVNYKLAKYANLIGYIPEAYMHYVQNDSSITNHNASRKIYELMLIFDELDSYITTDINDYNNYKIGHFRNLIFNNDNYKDDYYNKAYKYYIELIAKTNINYDNHQWDFYYKAFKKVSNLNQFKLVLAIYKCKPTNLLVKAYYKIKRRIGV